MLLELADNGQPDYRTQPRKSSPRSVQLPCKCVDGKIAYVFMPADNGGVWMRGDKFKTMLSDSGYTVEGTELGKWWEDLGKTIGTVAGTAANVFTGGAGSQIGGAIKGFMPGAPGAPGGGGDINNLLLGLIMGGKAPGGILQPPPQQQQPAPSSPNYILPLAIGGGVLLVTLLLSRK